MVKSEEFNNFDTSFCDMMVLLAYCTWSFNAFIDLAHIDVMK